MHRVAQDVGSEAGSANNPSTSVEVKVWPLSQEGLKFAISYIKVCGGDGCGWVCARACMRLLQRWARDLNKEHEWLNGVCIVYIWLNVVCILFTYDCTMTCMLLKVVCIVDMWLSVVCIHMGGQQQWAYTHTHTHTRTHTAGSAQGA